MKLIKESELQVGDFIRVNGVDLEVTHVSKGQVNFVGADYENAAVARHNLKRLGIQCYTKRSAKAKCTFTDAYVTSDGQLNLPMEMVGWLLEHTKGRQLKITVETAD